MSSRSDRWDHNYRPPRPPDPDLIGIVWDEQGNAVPANGRAAEEYGFYEELSDLGITAGIQKQLHIIASANERLLQYNRISAARLRGLAERPSLRIVESPPKLVALSGFVRRV